MPKSWREEWRRRLSWYACSRPTAATALPANGRARPNRPEPRLIVVCALLVAPLMSAAQPPAAFPASRDHAAIGYSTRPRHDAIAELNSRLATGAARLTFDARNGYLRSLLNALEI